MMIVDAWKDIKANESEEVNSKANKLKSKIMPKMQEKISTLFS